MPAHSVQVNLLLDSYPETDGRERTLEILHVVRQIDSVPVETSAIPPDLTPSMLAHSNLLQITNKNSFSLLDYTWPIAIHAAPYEGMKFPAAVFEGLSGL